MRPLVRGKANQHSYSGSTSCTIAWDSPFTLLESPRPVSWRVHVTAQVALFTALVHVLPIVGICLAFLSEDTLTSIYRFNKMGYDDHVYLAKLAEQAERYEGEVLLSACVLIEI